DDEATVAEVTDSRAFSDFCGVESSNQIPDGDTLGRFRNLLVKNELQEKLFAQVVEQLTARGLIPKKGTIVDSTIIAAPTSTKNKERKRDSNAHQTRNGNATMMSELLTEEEEVVYGDSGYLGAEKREEAIVKNRSGKLIKYKLNRRPSQSKDNSVRSKAQIKRRERDKSSVRSKVEHVFGVVKGLLRYRKTRYKGLRKQTAKLNIMFALANLILADRPHLAA
ncbi:MAG: transposase, partial [Oscillospiraceae bacterium]|nr:transposase [Oscillospiraceae bacterium]